MSDNPKIAHVHGCRGTEIAGAELATNVDNSFAAVADVIEVGRTSKAAYSPLVQSWGFVNHLQATALSLCTNFASVDDHVEKLASSGLSDGAESLRNTMLSLIERGFMVSRRELLSLLSQKQVAGSGGPATVDCLSIPTCNRPALLDRALESYLKNLRKYGRVADVLIVDDSPSDTCRKENYSILRRISETAPDAIKLIYVDKMSRSRFAERVSALCGVPLHLITLALLGDAEGTYTTHGASRNAQVLALQGRCWVTVDDDTVCSLHARPPFTKELLVGRWTPGSGSVTEHHFYPTLAEALKETRQVEADFLHIHEEVLGRSLVDLVSEAQDSVSVLNPLALVRSMEAGSPRVAVSGLGFIGDCATDWLGHYFLLDEKSVRRLAAEPLRLYELMESRQVSVCTQKLTVWNGNILRAMTLGVDGRRDLPPFSPIDRGEEHVFAELIRTCLPDSLYALHPLMLQHQPSERKLSPDWWNVQLLRPAHVLNGFLQTYRCPDQAPSFNCRLSGVGLYLERIGTLSQAHFVEEVLMRTWRRTSAMIRVLETRSTSLFRAPELREQAEKGIDALMKQALLQNGACPNLAAIVAEPRWGFLQNYCRDFGRLVQAWPQILHGVRSMQDGHTEMGIVV